MVLRVWNVTFHFTGRTQAGGNRERGAEEDIWTQERWGTTELEKSCNVQLCDFYSLPYISASPSGRAV